MSGGTTSAARTWGSAGAYREIVPPERIVHDELFDEDWTGGETVVTTLFSEENGKTTVTMTARYSSSAARDQALGTGMTKGVEAELRQARRGLGLGVSPQNKKSAAES